jgi:non-heme chloroperoxidase
MSYVFEACLFSLASVRGCTARHKPPKRTGLEKLLVPLLALTLVATGPAFAQKSASWHDPSNHRVQFVTVEDGVQLEVLDWGGSGRPVVLLAGSGNTAHIFDDFAAKLSDSAHVYGITRRGFGASTHPESGYTDQRLADDVLQVLDSLKIVAPVLVGHSMAGGELTTLGSEHSDRLGGLVYLDAALDPKDLPADDPAYMALYHKLPAEMRKPPSPPAAVISFQAYRDYQMRNEGFAFPESELRNGYESNLDGTMGKYRTADSVFGAIDAGSRKRDYSKIRVPVLAFFPDGRGKPPYQPKDAHERTAIAEFNAATAAYTNKYKRSLQNAAAGVRIVDVPRANHYFFLSNQTDVLRELLPFLAGLH